MEYERMIYMNSADSTFKNENTKVVEKTEAVRSRTKEYVIDGAKYIVTSTFSETAKETVEDKVLKYISDKVSSEIKSAD
jgi:hypothetical protein